MGGHDNQPLVGHAPRPTVRQVLGALPQIVRSLRPGPDRPRFPKDANQAMPEQVVGDLLFDADADADEPTEDGAAVLDDAAAVELFDTPQVRTDEQGREHQLVDADGQATFVPVDERAGDSAGEVDTLDAIDPTSTVDADADADADEAGVAS